MNTFRIVDAVDGSVVTDPTDGFEFVGFKSEAEAIEAYDATFGWPFAQVQHDYRIEQVPR